MAYLAWCVLTIIGCFLIGAIVNVETFRSERYYEDHESPYVKALRGD